MPAKPKGTKMSLSDFTGGDMGANYIPTKTEDLEGMKNQQAAEREQRSQRHASNTAPGSHYGASGAAGASADWRGSGGPKQPDAPPVGSGGGLNDRPAYNKFSRAKEMEWSRDTERAQPDSRPSDGKAFGGTGFGQQPQFGGGGLGGGISRDAFGGAKAAPDGPGQRGMGYNPVAVKPDRGYGGGGGGGMGEFSRDAMMGSAIGGGGQSRGGGTRAGPGDLRSGGPPGRAGYGGERGGRDGDRARGGEGRGSTFGSATFSRDGFGEAGPRRDPPRAAERGPRDDDGDGEDAEGKWKAPSRGQRGTGRQNERPAGPDTVTSDLMEKRLEREAEQDQATKDRLEAKLAALAEKARAEEEERGDRRGAGGGRRRDDRRERGGYRDDRGDRDARRDRRERRDRDHRDDREWQRDDDRGYERRSTWADAGEEPQEVEVRKSPSDPLGIVCQNGTLKLQQVKALSPAEEWGCREFIGWRLTHVNGEPISEMSQVRYIAGHQAAIRLRFDPTDAEDEYGDRRREGFGEKGPARYDDDDRDDDRADEAPRREPEPEADPDPSPAPAQFKIGDKVQLTDEGCDEITADEAWEHVPLRKGQVGTVIDWDNDESPPVPIIRGPPPSFDQPGPEMGLHPAILMRATGAALAAEAMLQREHDERRRQKEEERRRAAEAEAARVSQTALKSSFNPLAEPFIPAAMKGAPGISAGHAAAGAAPGMQQGMVAQPGQMPQAPQQQAAQGYAPQQGYPPRPGAQGTPAGYPQPQQPQPVQPGHHHPPQAPQGAGPQPMGPERRIDVQDGRAYTQDEFYTKYGRPGVWERAQRAPLMPVYVERRLDPNDGKAYNEQEFLARYGVPQAWQQAKPLSGAPQMAPQMAPPGAYAQQPPQQQPHPHQPHPQQLHPQQHPQHPRQPLPGSLPPHPPQPQQAPPQRWAQPL